LDELYFRQPFYGEPKLTQWLRKEGYTINSKRVRRLMGWQVQQANATLPDTKL